MRILIDLINFPKGCNSSYDWRYKIFLGIGNELRKRGHEVWSVNQFGVKKGFKRYTRPQIFDYYICHTPYAHKEREGRWKAHTKQGKPVTCYDHGWLPKSIVTDRKRLFGDSFYYNTIRDIVKQYPTPTQQAEVLRTKMLSEQLSKRPQESADWMKPLPTEKFIFIPGQVLYDASVVYYSDIGLKELIKRVVTFAKDHGLHVVYKPHPGLMGMKSHGKTELQSFQHKLCMKYKFFHVSGRSIFELMQTAAFTACVNSGSIIDNIVSQTPVYCCGRSFFSNSGTVIYNPNVEQGLTTMLENNYDTNEMKQQQLRMLWWLSNNLIQEKMPVKQQIDLLSTHSGVKL